MRKKTKQLKVLFASSEAHPLMKTGGLADVSGSLPQALLEQGVDIRLVLPAYPKALEQLDSLAVEATLELPGCIRPVRILSGHLKDCPVPIYLVDSHNHFNRPGNPYTTPEGEDWPDNAERFTLFCRAVVQMAMDRCSLNWRPDLVHGNDWQSGLIAPLLSFESNRPSTLFTIHNLAYQGLFDHPTFLRLKLPDSLWALDGLEFHHQLSFIKGGLAFSDQVNTVSPTYAREIKTPEFGYGLEGILQHREDTFSGIINGIDYNIWNPETDPSLEQHFDADTIELRIENKRALQREYHLPVDDNAMLFGYVGRLVDQKGVDLILQVLPGLMDQAHTQIIFLGTGDSKLEERLQAARDQVPERVGVYIGYDEARAHRIEAGCDCFLMPSRFEPCGLNQLYSLRYGAVPLVRRTGGLADTVVDVTAQSWNDGTATGFVFDQADTSGLWNAVDRAIQFYRHSADKWSQLAARGMQQDFSWTTSAEHYKALYKLAIKKPKVK